MLTEKEADRFRENAYRIRTMVLRMVTNSRWGHIGGSFSLAEILAVLYGRHVRRPTEECTGDRVVLSKAHASPALYSVLCIGGRIAENKIWRYCAIDGLDGHLDRDPTLGIDATGGSLGTGLSLAVGMALALRMKGDTVHRIYCVVGDGELQEGQNWEAMMAAAQYRLDRLIVIIDYNKVQAKGFIHEEIGLEPLEKKLSSFGMEVIVCDGHDVADVDRVLTLARDRFRCGRPVCILAHTVKGKGVRDFEFNPAWHTHAPSAEQCSGYLAELSECYGYAKADLPGAPLNENSLWFELGGTRNAL